MHFLPFDEEWNRCAPWIEAALAYARGTHTVGDVRDMVVAGDAQLWPGHSAAVVTEILVYPQLKALHFWLCGGDLTELVEKMRPQMERWGLEHGCTRFTTAGRPGWRRVMAKYGYEPMWDITCKDVAA